MKLRTVLSSPWTYLGWLAFPVAAFLVTYHVDPYVYLVFGYLREMTSSIWAGVLVHGTSGACGAVR